MSSRVSRREFEAFKSRVIKLETALASKEVVVVPQGHPGEDYEALQVRLAALEKALISED